MPRLDDVLRCLPLCRSFKSAVVTARAHSGLPWVVERPGWDRRFLGLVSKPMWDRRQPVVGELGRKPHSRCSVRNYAPCRTILHYLEKKKPHQLDGVGDVLRHKETDPSNDKNEGEKHS